ncbi:MAG: polysaccharide biosynthesis protein [Candidatus Egerieousia sp.]
MATILRHLVHWYFTRKALPYWCVLMLDCVIVMISGYVGHLLVWDATYFVSNFWPITYGLLISLLLYIVAFRVFHTYSGIIRYSSFVDLMGVGMALLLGSVMTFALSFLADVVPMDMVVFPCPITILVIFVMSAFLMFCERVVVKKLYDEFRTNVNAQKVFIYGIHQGGVSISKYIQNQTPQKYSLAGFIAPSKDDPIRYLMGVKVFREQDGVIRQMRQAGADILIVSPLQIDYFRKQKKLIDDLIANNIKMLVVAQSEEWNGKDDVSINNLHDVDVVDLLPRDKIEVNMDAIGELLRGKSILITGAAGSIGSEMVRQVAVYNPSEMVLIDLAETPLHDIRLMMAAKFPGIKACTIVTTITDKGHMEKIFSEHHPDYVFHAAAYKHVPMMEDNPEQAVRNNINGTRIIADLAVKYGTKKFVMISTDKAVNPTNVMGCSKRICEIYCQSLNKAIVDGKVKGVTQFVTTRFGNVLGSNGSVIPLFKQQIMSGGPITVTHPDIIRFFMLIPEACKLVLEAGAMGKGGEIFVFDMGEPVRIVDLAKRMIALSGAKNIEIQFTGLREGEKLYEEVLSDNENTKPSIHPKILVASVREYDYETACKNEERLLAASETFDDMAIVKIMKEIVPEFKSKVSKYEVLDK